MTEQQSNNLEPKGLADITMGEVFDVLFRISRVLILPALVAVIGIEIANSANPVVDLSPSVAWFTWAFVHVYAGFNGFAPQSPKRDEMVN